MKKLHSHLDAGPLHVGALERLQQQEDRLASRDHEKQLLAMIKAERDPRGPNGEVDLRLASPHFTLAPAPAVRLANELKISTDAKAALNNAIERDRDDHVRAVKKAKRRKR